MELTKVKLGDYLEEFGDGIHGTPNYDENGEYYFINGNNLDNGAILIDSETKRISSDEYDSIKRNLNNRTLLLSINGTLGRLAYYNGEKIALGKSACFLNFKENTDRRYFRYILEMKDFRQYMSKVASGSTIKNFSPRQAADYEFFAPKPDDQKKIASVLSALDDKIALNKKMNQKLERMAKRLYDYWFVQYDFPDKNGHPYKTTGGPMTYNPTLKREIPVGWEVKTLKECIKHINTGLNPRDNFVLGNGDIKYVTVKNLTMEGNIDFSGCDFIDEDALKKVHKRSDIAKGDVLYASICPLGRSYLINKDPVGWDINESVFSIRPNLDVISSEFLSVFLKDSAVVEKASKMATGSIFKGIRIKELENMILAVPVKDVMEKFSKQIKNLIELEHKNTEQIAHLTTLRDKLLPLLMNGQVTLRG